MQTDPVGVRDDLNLFTYVLNDPMNGKDPTGAICIGQDSDYCERAEHYDTLDAEFGDKAFDTTYFGAVSDLTENLANIDLPIVGELASGIGSEVGDYLNDLSESIEDFNDSQAEQIRAGEIRERGRALDSRLVGDEQKFIQSKLNELQGSNPRLYDSVIAAVNSNVLRFGPIGVLNSMTDANMAIASMAARIELGRPINYANEHDRIVMGKYLTQVRRH